MPHGQRLRLQPELVPTLTNPTLQLAVPRSASTTRNNPEIDLDSL